MTAHDHATSPALDTDRLDALLEAHRSEALPRLRLMWRYYRNPLSLSESGGVLRARPGQRQGLPERLVGPRGPEADDRQRLREIVIENDIAWRIHTMVDFMFGKPVRLRSTARNPRLRESVERILDAVWEASGGVSLLQDLALLGHVYGHVDLLVRLDEPRLRAEHRPDPWAVAESVRLEPVEPTRGVPVLATHDWRRLEAYIVHDPGPAEEGDRPPERPFAAIARRIRRARPAPSGLVEVFEPGLRRVILGGRARPGEPLELTGDRVPVVHIQNVAQPFRYTGLSEVEPLIPLQDELNTRLSDRASRVTLQSFKMYLARGIEGFETMPVGPGQIWSTDNPDASVEAFGGDASSPSEDAHIREIRDALDKTSGVPPLATGVVQGRVGNLSSANALKITLVGLLAKTERKRITYGRGIAEASRLVLDALDAAGLLPSDPRDRGLRLEWPDPLPTDVADETLAAKRKLELGVPPERVLDELGYLPTDPGVG